MIEKIDVLAVLRDLKMDALCPLPNCAACAKQNEAVTAIAELLAADREYDAAHFAWDAVPARLPDDSGYDYDSPKWHRLTAANERRAEALAAFA
ncbi:hypothetical protein LF41_2376 [Lysobacter dokdonensis DS-58]|uniref:Uncharacterized protein n=1 Tax=Lysobacter dokdonensis DS-58 TaxID=1300345 RepID=A0A0A2X3N4_9GAMM|nr:hypothetical protein [Lysobacter dokdonensis]KGQ19869.1 hypothetical protein LF41_2376 [Lysobacter dokdonensis DS-58]